MFCDIEVNERQRNYFRMKSSFCINYPRLLLQNNYCKLFREAARRLILIIVLHHQQAHSYSCVSVQCVQCSVQFTRISCQVVSRKWRRELSFSAHTTIITSDRHVSLSAGVITIKGERNMDHEVKAVIWYGNQILIIYKRTGNNKNHQIFTSCLPLCLQKCFSVVARCLQTLFTQQLSLVLIKIGFCSLGLQRGSAEVSCMSCCLICMQHSHPLYRR